MLLMVLVCWPVFFVGNRIGRWEGGLFLFYYIAYLWYQGLEASGSSWQAPFERLFLFAILPLTLLGLVLGLAREVRRRRGWQSGQSGLEAPVDSAPDSRF